MSELADLLERYRRGAELVAMATTGAAGPEVDFRPGENKWSLRMIVCHVSDSELVAVARFRQTIAEDDPVLQAYDQNAWAAHLDYSRRKISQALETFRKLRGDTYELFQELPEAAFSRTARHTERGSITLLDQLRYMAEHAEAHVTQMRNVRAAFKEHKAKQAAP